MGNFQILDPVVSLERSLAGVVITDDLLIELAIRVVRRQHTNTSVHVCLVKIGLLPLPPQVLLGWSRSLALRLLHGFGTSPYLCCRMGGLEEQKI